MTFESLLALDERISTRLRVAEKPGLLRNLAVFFAHSGDSWFWILGLLVVWLAGTPFWKVRALVLATSILVTALLVMLIKFTVRRGRPAGEWGEVYRNTDPHSFPSGHAARAFLLAVLACGMGPLWLGVLLWVWAPFVGLARVAMGVHYLSDVLAGVVLGLLMGWVNLNLAPEILTALGWI